MEKRELCPCQIKLSSSSMEGSLRRHTGGFAATMHPIAGQKAWGAAADRLEMNLMPADATI